MRQVVLNAIWTADAYSRWHRLRGLGNSSLVRLSLLMPVIGYLILLNKSVGEHLQLDPRIAIWLSDSPFRLLLIYYGTFLVAAGSAIYALWCPYIVKKYASEVEYSAAELDFVSTPNHRQQFISEVENQMTRASRLQRELPGYASSASILADPSDENAGILRELLALQWHLRDTSFRFARVVCASVFIAGFAILLVPAVITFFEVSFSLIR